MYTRFALSLETYRIRLDRPGDQICIFGFSRGAYTARALAGMLQKVGLLPPCNVEHLPFAYAMYAKDNDENLEESLHFKRAFSIDVRIRFLGVWWVIQHIDQLPTSYLRIGTLYNLSDWFQNTCRSAVRTMPFRTSATRWLSMNAASSSSHPSAPAKTPRRSRIQSPRTLNTTRPLARIVITKSKVDNRLARVNSISKLWLSKKPTLKRCSSPAPTAVHSGSSTHNGFVTHGCLFRCRGWICEKQ